MIITKRGRPVVKLVPVRPDRALFGAMAGSVARQNDLVSPLGEPWEADSARELFAAEVGSPTGQRGEPPDNSQTIGEADV